MNRLNLARRTQIINCLVEGNSIRSTERMTDTHRDTVMRLMVEAGEGCARTRWTPRCAICRASRIQVDEIWALRRQEAAPDDAGRRSLAVGDIGPSSPSIPIRSWSRPIRVGKRDLPTATAFMDDLSERLANRVQLSSDALAAYVEAVEAGVRRRCRLRAGGKILRSRARRARPLQPAACRAAANRASSPAIPMRLISRPAWSRGRTSPCG